MSYGRVLTGKKIMRLNGKVTIVTGEDSGIGKAVTLARPGADAKVAIEDFADKRRSRSSSG